MENKEFKAEDWCLFLLLAAMAGEPNKTETPEHVPSEAYGPDNGEYYHGGDI